MWGIKTTQPLYVRVLVVCLFAAIAAVGLYQALRPIVSHSQQILENSEAIAEPLLSAQENLVKRALEIGHTGVIFDLEGPQGEWVFGFMKVSVLTIELVDGQLKVSTQIRDENGELIAELQRNEWKIAPPPPKTFDRNFTDNALEVRDPSGHIVLQIKLAPDRIQIQGEWWDMEGKGLRILETGDSTYPGQFVLLDKDHKGEDARIVPMFNYPSELHFGELTVN
jgi:hypothetical protein